ncbi:MAG TPA: SapC family protein [Caulobacteraceae bacterium]|jgi:hypothetical protein|nr:SapC family protein [Caulobacteraceae bacterium]
MEASELPPGAITGAVLLYSRPEPLTPELHNKLGVKRMDNPFAFAADQHLLPLTVTEFQPAALNYPIIFVGDEQTPVAVMGLKEGENLFLSKTGVHDAEYYMPAYVRRYPFVFANDQTSDRMILCIDRGASVLDENGGDVALFDGNEPSEFTKGAMEFCREFESERRRTEDFIKLLKDLDLFEVKQAMFTPRLPDGQAGEPQMLAEYFAVSEDKLSKLPLEKIQELFANGALQQIYAHLMSLLNWERLLARAVSRAPVAANA